MDDLIFTRGTTDTDDLIITFDTIAGSITLDEQYADAGVEIFQFADGSALTEAQAYALVGGGGSMAMAGGSEAGALSSFGFMSGDEIDLSGLPASDAGMESLVQLTQIAGAVDQVGFTDFGTSMFDLAMPLAADAMMTQ